MKNKSNSKVFLRPRFTVEIQSSKEKFLKVLETKLSHVHKKYTYKISDDHLFIDICDKESHFWSPHLHVEILKNGKNNAILKGLFSPKPQVWTLFMFLHFVIGVSFLAFVTMLYVYHTLDKNIVFPLLMTIVLPVLWFALYFIGRIGRDFGKNQMQELHNFLLTSISET